MFLMLLCVGVGCVIDSWCLWGCSRVWIIGVWVRFLGVGYFIGVVWFKDQLGLLHGLSRQYSIYSETLVL